MRIGWPWLLLLAGCETIAGLGDFTDAPLAPSSGGGGPTVAAITSTTGGGRGGSPGTGGREPATFGEPTTIVDGLEYPLGIALDDSHLFVTENRGQQRVLRLPHDGTGVAEALASQQAAPWGIVVDDDFAYYYSRDDQTARRVPKAGGNVDDIGTLEEKVDANVTGMARADGILYFADEANGIVAMPDTPGSTPIYLTTAVGTPSDIRVRGGLLYTNDKTGNLFRLDLTTQAITPLATGLSNPLGFDLGTDELYVCEKDADEITRIPLAGGDPERLALVPDPHRLVTDGTYVYVTERQSCAIPGRVYAVDLADGSDAPIAEDLDCPLGIVVNDDAIFILNTGPSNAAGGSVLRIPKL